MADDDVLTAVRSAMAQSELVAAAISVRRDGGYQLALGDIASRPLTRNEISYLESLANTAEDWSRVRVADEFDCSRVHHSSFHGDVILGRFAGELTLEEGVRVPAGIYRSTVANCVIGHNALVHDVKLLANYVVGPDAQLSNCPAITCGPATSFGNGQSLSLGIESGGREVPIFAEISVPEAAALSCGSSRRLLWQPYARAIADYLGRVASSRGIIEAGACLRNTPTIRNAYVGKYAQIDGATLVADSTLLSSRQAPAQVLSGACVSHAILQPGSRVATLAIVERSVLTIRASVENHAKVTGSIVGPDTQVAEGEVAACLLGPMIDFRHQALLMAVLWPDGKGMVSYGANVGANQTGEGPDQEFRLGEGTFLGLGVNIKFPADFSASPFSVIGCGVKTMPQKVMFPFALINGPSARWDGIAPYYNEIFPAWVLTDNLYAIMRLESKYGAWSRTRRSRAESDVFRPQIVDLMLDACRRLQAVTFIKEVYTESDIQGLGKNVVLEAQRRRAIDAYQFFAKYDALLGLKRRVHGALHALQGRLHGGLGGWRNYAVSRLLETPADEARWEHQRRVLLEEMQCVDVAAALAQLPKMLEMVAESVELAKARNNERGMHIIDDYAETHVSASQDALVQQTWTETRRLQQEVNSLLSRLKFEESPQETPEQQ